MLLLPVLFLVLNHADMAFRRTSRLHINLLLHPFESSSAMNSTHSATLPYDPTHEYPTHCRTILKKSKDLRSAFIGYPLTASAALTDSNTFVLLEGHL